MEPRCWLSGSSSRLLLAGGVADVYCTVEDNQMLKSIDLQ
jgi:hypothetical protein